MIHPLLLALALLGPVDAGAQAPGSERDAGEAAPLGAAASAAGDAPAATTLRSTREDVEEFPGDHRGARHALGFGPHTITFFSEEGSQYTFHSGSLGYLGSSGARGVFVHAFALLPLQARQDGRVYATANYYRRRIGGDLLAGWQWRWTVHRDVEAEVGPGLHGTLLYLPGKPGYRDFSALPLGLGAGAVLRWGTRARRLSRPVTVGAYASVAYDFYDPLRANDLDHGFTVRAGVVVGLGDRR